MVLSSRAVVVLLAFSLAACGKAPEPDEADIAEAREAAKALGGQLKTRLVSAMKEGGPTAGIEVCAEAAPQIAQEVSEKHGLTVGRTALRVRNPGNAPDAWETKQLEMFTKAVAEGEDIATMEVAELVKEGEGMALRWAKPIPMGAPCAACHGSNVSDEIKTAIAARYPDDKATGFEAGEVRGMFTVTKPVTAK